MAEYVRMPKADYVAACNSIRAKTGKEDKIKSGAMATEIDSITTGGGSSEDVRYVTFMSEDGSIEYGKKAVAVGDDCADPIARNVFNKPTKESTVQYNYSHYGWANEPNGPADPGWDKSISEDKTVYANFASTVRYYTITYYDGDAVLKTDSMAYGSSPSYSPTKDGYSFDGWEPALKMVTGDASYQAKWIESITFAGSSWSNIARVCEAGEAENYFKLGDTRDIVCNGNTYQVQIIGINHDDLADGSGKAGISCVLTGSYGNYAYNSSSANVEWPDCSLRTYCNGTIYNGLESDLKSVVKQVVKKSFKTGGSNSANDYCWVLSGREVGHNYSWGGLGNIYAAFPSKDSAKIGTDYHLRDTNGSSKQSYYVSQTAVNIVVAGTNTTSRAVRFGFCI